MHAIYQEDLKGAPGGIMVLAAVIVDVITISACGLLSAVALGHSVFTEGQFSPGDWFTLILVVALTWPLVNLQKGGYSQVLWNAGVDLYVVVLRSAPIAFSGSLVLAFFIARDVGGTYILLFLTVSTTAVLIERSCLRSLVHYLHRRGLLLARVILVGTPCAVAQALRRFESTNYAGVRIIRTFARSDEGFLEDGAVVSSDLIGLNGILADSGASYVILCGAQNSMDEVDLLAWSLREANVSLALSVDTTHGAFPTVQFVYSSGLPVLKVRHPELSKSGRTLKRVFDVITSATLLVVLAPVFLLIALLIVVEDGRPVFFRQKRVGLEMANFQCLKFRSMFRDAAEREAELRRVHHRPGQMWKVENDPRITKVGKFIRATSLDEIPQLINVLRGDMSIVGPRPKQGWELVEFSAVQLRRLSMKPGLTGLSQISGRSDLSVDEATRLDLDYLQNWSIFRDIVICMRTVLVVTRGSGAY